MRKGLILIFSTALISGFSVFLNKYGASVGDPYIFAFLKNSLVALFLSALVLGWRDRAALRSLSPKQWGGLLLVGLIGGSVPFLLFFKGLSLTSAAQGSFVHKSMFIFISVLAVWLLKEKLNKNFILGGLLLMAGNLFILKKLAFQFGWGDLLVLMAVLLWAGENILSKHLLKKLSGNIVAWGRIFFGAIFIFVFLALSGQLAKVASATPTQWFWIIITAVLLLGYNLTWYNGLKNVPVSLASAILLLGSPITTLLTIIASGKIVFKDIFSSILIISGLVLILCADWLWRRVKIYVRT